jgi:cytochrome c oxidase subunit II
MTMLSKNNKRGLLTAAAVCVISMGTYTASLFAERAQHAQERVIKMSVKRFEYSPREIALKRGVPVVLEISSLDVPHGFNLPDLKVRADVIPGQVTRVRLVPDRAGTFTFRCDVFCGTGHEELDGLITVSE